MMLLISDKQQKLLKALEALNDILVSETKKGKEKRVVESIENLTNQVENIFELEQQQFENLMFNPDSNGNESYFSWGYEDYSKPYTLINKIFFDLYQTAMHSNTQDIALHAGIGLIHLLKLITPSVRQTQDYTNYAKLLEVYFSFHNKLFRNAIDKNDPHSHQLAYRWYTGRVFNGYENEEEFNINVLPVLDKHLFNNMQYAIKHSNREWFKEFLSWMHHGIGFNDNLNISLYEFTNYEHYNEFDGKLLSKLDSEFEDLYSRDALNEWLGEFEVVKLAVVKKYPNKSVDEIIRSVYQQHSFLNLKQMIHGLSAYIIYLEKYKYIRDLWTFKQPDGASASWLGHSIIPEDIVELIRIFPINQRRENCFHDEHIDCVKYRLQYEVLFMAYLITRDDYRPTTSYTLSTDEVYLSGLKYYMEQLDRAIDDVLDNNNLCTKLDINRQSIEETKEQLHTIVAAVKQECESKIETNILTAGLEDRRIEAFKKGFVDEYRKTESIKQLFKLYNSFEEELEVVKKDRRFGVNQLAPKNVFNSKLVMGVDMFGSDYARQMVNGLRKTILDDMINKSEEVHFPLSLLTNKIELENMLLIVFRNRDLFRDPSFEGAWRDKESNIDHPAFDGWYVFKKTRIPVFRFNIDMKDKFLVLDKTRLPYMHQYSPAEVNSLIEEFYISIADMNDEPDLIETIVKRENLTADQQESRRLELKKQVKIEIYESFEVTFDNYIGYLIDGKHLV